MFELGYCHSCYKKKKKNLLIQGCPSTSDGIFHPLCIIYFHTPNSRKILFCHVRTATASLHLLTLSVWTRRTLPLAHQLISGDEAFPATLRRSKKKKKCGEKQRPCGFPGEPDSQIRWKSYLKLECSKIQTQDSFPTGNKE